MPDPGVDDTEDDAASDRDPDLRVTT